MSAKSIDTPLPVFKWNKEVMENATKNLVFLKVGGAKVVPRVLSGTVRSWKSPETADKNIIFVLPYRLTGTAADIRKTLENALVPAQDVKRAIDTAITYQNHKNVEKSLFIADENKKRATKKNFKEEDKELWENILSFSGLKKDKKYKLVPKNSDPNKGVTKATLGAGNRKTLATAVKNVANGKVIDVSGLDTKTGTGYITIPAPKPNSKSGKYGVDDVLIVSNNILVISQPLILFLAQMPPKNRTLHKWMK